MTLLTKTERMYHKLINYFSSGIIILFILFVPESCSFTNEKPFLKNGQTGGLLKDIKSRGTLVALTDDNSFNYFNYEGESYGYQYELLKLFADHLGVSLEIIVEPDVYKALQYLQQRKVDIVAMELPKILDDNFDLAYTTPIYSDFQVLVQQKSNNRSKDKKIITDINELRNKTITLPANKQAQFYLSDIQHANSNAITIEALKNSTVNELIENVSDGTIDYSLAFEKSAKAMMLSCNNIDVQTRVSPRIDISWVVRKGAVNLLEETNTWISENKESHQFATLQSRYFDNPRWVKVALGKPLDKRPISDYDEIIRQMSKKIGWDWRLVAALIYQESRFNSNVISHRGAFGLMQLMPSTATKFGANKASTANEQIAAGVKLLNYLDKRLSKLVPDINERKKFVLAAYNIGLAHILDARNLAEKYDKDPTVWHNNVDYFLLAKSKPEYYNDSVVKYGRISGKETHRFVMDVMDRYEHYKTLALK
jgi:membrane-bound lytic murein transglycosylase F